MCIDVCGSQCLYCVLGEKGKENLDSISIHYYILFEAQTTLEPRLLAQLQIPEVQKCKGLFGSFYFEELKSS